MQDCISICKEDIKEGDTPNKQYRKETAKNKKTHEIYKNRTTKDHKNTVNLALINN